MAIKVFCFNLEMETQQPTSPYHYNMSMFRIMNPNLFKKENTTLSIDEIKSSPDLKFIFFTFLLCCRRLNISFSIDRLCLEKILEFIPSPRNLNLLQELYI